MGTEAGLTECPLNIQIRIQTLNKFHFQVSFGSYVFMDSDFLRSKFNLQNFIEINLFYSRSYKFKRGQSVAVVSHDISKSDCKTKKIKFYSSSKT